MSGSARRRRPVQERARESRERILAAAGEVFAERGVVGSSTNRIAAHAGVSIGLLYRYFGDKDEIVVELRTRLLAEVEERFTAAVVGGMGLPVREQIGGSMTAIMHVLSEREALVRALIAETEMQRFAPIDLERRLLLLTRAYLVHQLGPVAEEVLDRRAQVMVTTGLAACFRIALGPLPSADRDGLIDETARMIGAWIDADRA
ncbi:AcrR family transcriptional regulator [Nocardia sp. GAS34]|uniref:TetR/AcrR family transcriptional regulator n=1 Tax=unclassified Nocardia TaxID=2637762 RepID=UPI003D243AAB